jgi:ABC-2 type transport system permease protein
MEVAAAAGERTGVNSLRAFLTMYRRAIREALSVPATTVMVPLVLPVFMLTIFGRVFSSAAELPGFPHGVEYATYIAPAAVLVGIMLGSATAGISTAMELQTGFFDRMRLAPLGTGMSMAGRRMADGTRLAFFAVVLTFASWADGVPIENWPLALGVAVALGASWGVVYGALALAASLKTANAETVQAMVPLFFPVLLMSTSLVPMELLPDGMQTIARYNPVSYICDSMRSATAGHFDAACTWKALLGIAVAGIVTQALIQLASRGRAHS